VTPLLSSGLLCGEVVDDGVSPSSRRHPSDVFSDGLLPGIKAAEASLLARDLWDESSRLPRRVRSEALRALASSAAGRLLLVAFFREQGRFAVAEFLDVDRLRLSEREKFRRGREVAVLLLECLPILEGSELDHDAVTEWSGSGVWLFRSFAGFLFSASSLPVSMFLDPPQPGLGPCVAGSIFRTYRDLPPEQQEVFAALLPEWDGSLAALMRSAALL